MKESGSWWGTILNVKLRKAVSRPGHTTECFCPSLLTEVFLSYNAVQTGQANADHAPQVGANAKAQQRI